MNFAYRITEKTELLRGFQLLLRQLKKKTVANKNSVQDTYNNIYNFCNLIVEDIQVLLSNLNGVIADESDKEEQVMQKLAGTGTGTGTASNAGYWKVARFVCRYCGCCISHWTA